MTALRRKFWVWLFAIVASLSLVSGAVWIYLKNNAPQLDLRSGAPNFERLDPQGNSVSLNDFAGKLVILHFWASWCEPCIDEIPEIVALADQFDHNKVVLLAVSLDSNWEESLRIFDPKDSSESVVFVLDPSMDVARSYGSYEYPETYLIGPDQNVITKWVGPQKWLDESYKRLILRYILGEKSDTH